MTSIIRRTYTYIFIFFVAFCFIIVCSQSSPLYAINTWTDANCFLTMGRGILNGLVPYRDLYEQKGPLLYMLHAFAAFISDTTFFGVFILEVISAFFFLLYSWKLLNLYSQKFTIIWIPVLAVIVFGCQAFYKGDSAEEFCLPLLSYALWLGLDHLKCEHSFSFVDGLLLGITSSCVLWIKYTMLGFYIGWIIVPAVILIKQHEFKKLFMLFGSILCGVLVISLPIILYFLANNALSDCFTVYFYNNIFLYNTVNTSNPFLSFFQHLWEGFSHIRIYSKYPFLFSAFGILWIIIDTPYKEAFKTAAYLISSISILFLFIYIGGRRFLYYSLPISTFAVLGLIPLSQLFEYFVSLNCFTDRSQINTLSKSFCSYMSYKIPRRIICVLLFVELATSVFFVSYWGHNAFTIQVAIHEKREDIPQYQFAQIINQKENATLLNYGCLDGGFYTICNKLPTCKYFCNLVIPLEEIMDTQNNYVEKHLVDFIITNHEQAFAGYQNVCQSSYSNGTYYLYALME